MSLLLATHTASWCLLEPEEARLAGLLRNQITFADLERQCAAPSEDRLREFLVRLYQRGLLRIDDRPGLDPEILAQGALFTEGNLVEILVTQKCNLACRYCLAEAGPEMPHLHPEIAFKAVDEAFLLRADVPLSIQLSGGEPFVNFKLFKEVVAYIEQKSEESGRRVAIVTQSNGTLIDDQIATFVKNHQIGIGISIDGPERLNNLSRPLLGGGQSHQRTVRGIKILLRRGIPFGTIVVLNKMNVDHPEELADFLVDLGVKSTKVNPISKIGDAQGTWASLAISAEEYCDFLERFIDHVLDFGLKLRESNLAEYLKYLVRRMHDYRCMRSNCGAGRSFFLVDASGDVYPCAHSAGIPEWKLGRLTEAKGDLAAMGRRNLVIAPFNERLVDRMEQTRSCPWRHFCEGGCAVNAYQRFGSILGPDTLCAAYERIYPALLARLAMRPAKFQTLLDLTFGTNQAQVVEFRLVQEPQRPERSDQVHPQLQHVGL
jgi:radical SAM protein with 4Fe4S-binding SPASM domain